VFLSVDDHVVMGNLNAFAAAGFGISIDDFGTGFSTLETLQRVPATEVKIDQTFVKSLAVRTADSIIVASIIKMAKGLNHRVVAEGIEDAATLRQLAAMGCDQGQGFHIGRPQPFDAFLALAGDASSRCVA
jgi:EAL domain-containing protein (putative c-di-GMP-specific phosphodiesterase class I)